MGDIVLAGATSGTITLTPTATAGSSTLTLPAANGTVITTASSGQSIPKAALPTGSVLQVVNATYATSVTNSTNTFADTGLTATITPTSTTSKILVIVDQNGCGKENGNNSSAMYLKIVRNSTDIFNVDGVGAFTFTDVRNYIGSISFSYLDSPATTSATTYKTQFRNHVNAASVIVQGSLDSSFPSTSTITLVEIAA
jgi:hypothetical protein